jgi:hypothetical protein
MNDGMFRSGFVGLRLHERWVKCAYRRRGAGIAAHL